MATKVDATSGNLIKKIFIYAIPLILTSLLQEFFNIADKAVLGNMAGSIAVAAIGTTGVVTSLITNGAIGISTGTIIILARYVGQKDEVKIRKTINTSLLTAVFLGLIIAIAGFFLAPAFLRATDCPDECLRDAVIYTRIYLASAPIILLYNYGSALLRTLGDTQRPLFYIIIAGGINVFLNVILCIIMTQKVAAVAIATLVSQAVSALLVLRQLTKLDDNVKLQVFKMRFHPDIFIQLLRYGIPSSISSLMVPLGNLQIVPAINSFGVDAIAGNSAATSLQVISSAFTIGFSATATTFIGQNMGANDRDRVKKSFRYIMLFNVLISGAAGVATYLSGRFWIGIIIGPSATAAIEYGMRRMFFVNLFMFVAAINGVLSHALQAFGYPLFTSISNIAFTLGFRILWMQFVYPLKPAFDTIMLCFLVSWSLNMLLYIVFFSFVYTRYTRKGIYKKI